MSPDRPDRFPIDCPVVVRSLGKTGRIVEAARNGRYRVRVGGVVVMCREDELAEASAGDRKRGRKKRAAIDADGPRRADASRQSTDARVAVDANARERRRLGSIDLHGFTVEEAVRKVEERIDLALRAGVDRLEIIHGRSSGRIKIAVHRLLGQLTAVRQFELDPKNPGVTRVFF